MKEKNMNVFDSEDIEFVNCLRGIGINRKQAMILAFFRVEETGTSRGIELATSLRQPEVSLALVALKPWIHQCRAANNATKSGDNTQMNIP